MTPEEDKAKECKHKWRKDRVHPNRYSRVCYKCLKTQWQQPLISEAWVNIITDSTDGEAFA